MYHNGRNDQKATIIFCRKSDRSSRNSYDDGSTEKNQPNLFLLSKCTQFNIIQFMPKNFTISTKDFTSSFNLEMLQEVSPIIKEYVINNPAETKFHLNINDEENVLSKFEQLFNGKTVYFNEDEIPTSHRITKLLQIKNCPNYLKPESLQSSREFDTSESYIYGGDHKMQDGVVIFQKWFVNYLNKPKFQKFTIITKKKEYICNTYGVYSSEVIREIIEKNPETHEYVYDIDDEFNEFQPICDLFNLNKVDITNSNMDLLKEIAEDLQINCIMKQINDYINKYEKFSKKIDEQQTIIDSIDELIDWLHNINELGIEKVKVSILQSKWAMNEENVQELAAFILQVVKPDFSLQKEIAELLIQLNNEANEKNKLNILLPFIIEKLMNLYMPKQMYSKTTDVKNNHILGYGKNHEIKKKIRVKIVENTNQNNRCIYSFIRILYKKGLITKDEIMNKLKYYECFNRTLNSFFLPEIIETNPKNITVFTNVDNDLYDVSFEYCYVQFMKKYLPDKINLYEKMLDNMEPDDEIIKSIRHDDVDTLQRIITMNEIDISDFKVPYNIFDDIEEPINILNYSALYGSLKCFKYLLLNNGNVDKSSLYFAVYGCNFEIIKIIDQRITDDNENDDDDNNNHYYYNTNNDKEFWYKYADGIQYLKNISDQTIQCLNYSHSDNIIASSIALHRNELFDWIFDKKYVSKGKVGNDLKRLAILSALSGNAHSLIGIIDNGFDVSFSMVNDSAKNGFCKLTQLLMSIYDQKAKKEVNNNSTTDKFDFESVVAFGNHSIFELFYGKMNQNIFEEAVLYAINMDYKEIVIHYFDDYEKLGFSPSYFLISNSLNESFIKETDEWFNFLFEKYKKIEPKKLKSLIEQLLDYACLYSNYAASKKLIDIIHTRNPTKDFSTAFIKASSSGSMSICKYLIEKKVRINYESLSSEVTELGSLDEDIFTKIINNVSPSTKLKFMMCIDQAIKNKNKKLIEFLIKNNAPIENALFKAVNTHDLQIVDIILKYNSKPSFINQKINDGTALQIAIQNKDLDIVKRLISIPGINPSLLNVYRKNALTSAIDIYDLDIVNVILDFYTNNQTNVSLFNDAIFYVSTFCLRNNDDKNSEKIWKIIMKLMTIKGIDPNHCKHTPLFYEACYQNKIEIVKEFLKIENIDVNKYDICSYNTPLFVAIENKNEEIAKLLINFPKTDINLKNSSYESPLMCAIKNEMTEIIDLILNNEKFDPIESRLTYAFAEANTKISRQLSTLNCLNVNKIFEASFYNNNYDDTDKIKGVSALYNSVKINDIEKIDMIINHPSFDIYKSDINESIFKAVTKNNVEVFEKLIKLIDNDVNIKNTNGESLLFVAAANLSGSIIDEIFSNPKFDSKNNQICEALVESYTYKYNKNKNNNNNHNNHTNVLNQHLIPDKSMKIEIINKIYDFDREHDKLIDFNQLLPNGKSYLTNISKDLDEIEEIVDFFIDHGVDPNMKDKDDDVPLEYAIDIDSLPFVTSLAKSDKLDYNAYYYLHMAAEKSNDEIFRFLLEKNVFDVNGENDEGDTPLMIACCFRNIKVIDLLFNLDNIDYLHCNYNGEDALDSIDILPQEEHELAKQSKEDYYDKIMELIQDESGDYYESDSD